MLQCKFEGEEIDSVEGGTCEKHTAVSTTCRSNDKWGERIIKRNARTTQKERKYPLEEIGFMPLVESLYRRKE